MRAGISPWAVTWPHTDELAKPVYEVLCDDSFV